MIATQPCKRIVMRVLCVLALTCSTGISAKTLEQANAAFARQDFKTAALIWRDLALAGDSVSQFNIALMRDTGKGIAQRLDLATYWYRSAALKGHSGAQFQLGAMYYVGRGVSKNLSETRKWWEASAKNGNINAQYSLGIFIMKHGTASDRVRRGIQMLRQASAKQHPGATELLRQIKVRTDAGKRVPVNSLPGAASGSTSGNWTAPESKRAARVFESGDWVKNLASHMYVVRIGSFANGDAARKFAVEARLHGPNSVLRTASGVEILTGEFQRKLDAWAYIQQRSRTVPGFVAKTVVPMRADAALGLLGK